MSAGRDWKWTMEGFGWADGGPRYVVYHKIVDEYKLVWHSYHYPSSDWIKIYKAEVVTASRDDRLLKDGAKGDYDWLTDLGLTVAEIVAQPGLRIERKLKW